MRRLARASLLIFLAVPCARAAPDEQKLGRDAGYPVGKAGNWYYDESVRVGSFSHHADIPGVALGNFNATLRDYARLGAVLANDGARPDDPARQVIPRSYLVEATDWRAQPEAFHPGKADRFWGYGYQFWLYPGAARRFALLGVYGQSIFVDPGLHLAIVQTGANATAQSGDTSLARERDAFWRGVVRYYTR